jgi:hypothetical protein
MSAVMNHPLGLEMTLLSSSLIVVKLAVLVGNFSRIVNVVSSNGDAVVVGLFLLWLDVGAEPGIGHLLVLGSVQ